MWFGNLVTMNWWDDLWLNESFADFISHLCLSKLKLKENKILDDPWISFNQSKQWGYEEDSHSTTHPIACNVEDTLMAENIFDGISYSKGAAVIR
jgi:aminopeptidase N